MSYAYFSRNGAVLPADQAVMSLSSIEFSYGFGVYETIRVSHGEARFADEHCARLMSSAAAIQLDHNFKPSEIMTYITDIVSANEVKSCNLKVLLIGGKNAQDANLFIMCLAPHFIDRKLYKTGCHCTTYAYERMYPHAKTLNMLPSYLAYREAHATGAHDALLINRHGDITEGTRSNFFTIRGTTIFSPPEDDILPGVTKDHMLRFAKSLGFSLEYRTIALQSLGDYDGAFLTSTSARILPIRSVDSFRFASIAPKLLELAHEFKK